MDPKTMMDKCMSKMRQAGMPEEKIDRWQAMMQTPVALDSPGAIYRRAEELGLSEEQIKQLQDIEAETREKALAVLSDKQREQVGETPTAPEPMMNMCKEMMPKMMEMMQGMMGGSASQDTSGESGK
ncbi:hypothetical protein [Paucidesulfovibrio longus]|uniref:hypothetical protein n=1 Tax=Paucidesulfovibrio longus TaxID=889 RepID=UPI0003B36BF2|nr:hypothetical protein [Paucidesulfovibrio longus]